MTDEKNTIVTDVIRTNTNIGKVMEVDIARARIALSMRMSDTPGEKPAPIARSQPARNQPRSERHTPQDKPAPSNSAMAALFANAGKIKKK